MLRLVRAAAAAFVLLASPAFAHNGVTHLGPINISVPFARATLPNAPVGGGFMTIENTGTEADRLVTVTTDVAAKSEIHEMSMDGQVMKMRALTDGLEIPAGETITLSPGGFHLMFMGLKGAFVEGQTINVMLSFEKAGTVELALPVLGAAADAAPAHTMSH